MKMTNVLSTLALAGFLGLASASCDLQGDPTLPGEALVGSDGAVDWNRYYLADESNRILDEFAALYPELTEVYTVGKSHLGADLMTIEITNEATGPASEKPALYLDGGIHAQELAASSVALYVVAHLLNGYGNDPEVTELLNTRAFYVRPKFNPDGSDLVLKEDQWLRSTVRPVDNNDDGIPDSDPPEDLDGDGRILSMRFQDPDGRFVISPDDDRIMMRRQAEDSGPFYSVIREGVDSNGDGEINSDGIGGSDMNRNFPRNWEPAFLQTGAYNFPLSEPETHAAANFVNDHRNITSIVHGHTSGGFVYRLPSASDPSRFNTTDLALIDEMGAVYTETTGRPVVPSATHPTEHRYGTFITFGYWDYGIVGWVPEYSPGPANWVPDADRDGEITEVDWHAYNDEAFGGKYFAEWTPFEHPELGTVEIGGWQTKFWGQNPPSELLEQELVAQVPWILSLAQRSPLLEVAPLRVTPLGDERFRVEGTVANTGWLPTHLTERGHVGRERSDGTLADPIVRAPLAILAVEGGTIEGGNGRVRMAHLAGSNPHTQAVSGRTGTVSFVVVRDAPSMTVQLTVESEKGGTVRSEPVVIEGTAGSAGSAGSAEAAEAAEVGESGESRGSGESGESGETGETE